MRAAVDTSQRGVLFPEALPTRFRRVPPRAEVSSLVAWWWLSEWSLPPGEVSEQHLIAFPSCNLAVEDSMVGLAGPTTRASTRRLEGQGWVVGALLKPAAVPALCADPTSVREDYVTLDEPSLLADVRDAVRDGLEAGIPVVERWLLDVVGELTETRLLANCVADLAATESAITGVAELAAAFDLSERSLYRLTASHLGLTPYDLIRRRRIQAAAEAVRTSGEDLARVAADHGFSDQAHLAREFRQVLGRTPTQYRTQAADRA